MILVLITGLAPRRGQADDKPIRLSVSERYGPIGRIRTYGKMTIDGRIVQGEQLIWGGEMLVAPADTGISIALDSVGQVTLREGAIARVSETPAVLEGSLRGDMLVASLVKGDMVVKLKCTAGAYVQASGSVFNASPGASFHVGVCEGQPALETISGEVRAEAQDTQRKLTISPLDDRGRPLGNGAILQVRLRTARDVQWQVTDENGKRVPDIPIIIALGSTKLGALGTGASTFSATTGANGIASVPITGTASGTTQITAQIPGTNATWSGQVSFAKAGILGLSTTAAVAIGAAAAAGLGLGVYYGTKSSNTPPKLGTGTVTVTP